MKSVNLRSRRGVTIVEVVVALLIITTISGVTLGMVMSSDRAISDGSARYAARAYANAALSAFQYSESKTEFEKSGLGLDPNGAGYTVDAKFYTLGYVRVTREDYHIDAGNIAFYTPGTVTASKLPFAEYDFDGYNGMIDQLNNAVVKNSEFLDADIAAANEEKTPRQRYDTTAVSIKGTFPWKYTGSKNLTGLYVYTITPENYTITLDYDESSSNFHKIVVETEKHGTLWFWQGKLWDTTGSYDWKASGHSAELTKTAGKPADSDKSADQLRYDTTDVMLAALEEFYTFVARISGEEDFVAGDATIGHGETMCEYKVKQEYEMTDITCMAAIKKQPGDEGYCEKPEHDHGIECYTFNLGGSSSIRGDLERGDKTLIKLDGKPEGISSNAIPARCDSDEMEFYYKVEDDYVFIINMYHFYYYVCFRGTEWYRIPATNIYPDQASFGAGGSVNFLEDFTVTLKCDKEEHKHNYDCGYGGIFVFEGYMTESDGDDDDELFTEEGDSYRILKELARLRYETDDDFKLALKQLNTAEAPNSTEEQKIYRYYESAQNVYRYQTNGAKLVAPYIAIGYSFDSSLDQAASSAISFWYEGGSHTVAATPASLSEWEDGYLQYKVKALELNAENPVTHMRSPLTVRYTFEDGTYLTVTYDNPMRMLTKLMCFRAKFPSLQVKNAALAYCGGGAYNVSYTVSYGGKDYQPSVTGYRPDTESDDEVKAIFTALTNHVVLTDENESALTVKDVVLFGTADGNGVKTGYKKIQYTFAESPTTLTVDYGDENDVTLFRHLTQFLTPATVSVNYANQKAHFVFLRNGKKTEATVPLDEKSAEDYLSYEDMSFSRIELLTDGRYGFVLYHTEGGTDTFESTIIFTSAKEFYDRLRQMILPVRAELSIADDGKERVSLVYSTDNSYFFSYALTEPEGEDAALVEAISDYLSLQITSADLSEADTGAKKFVIRYAVDWAVTLGEETAVGSYPLVVRYPDPESMLTALRHFGEPTATTYTVGADLPITYRFDANSGAMIRGTVTLSTKTGLGEMQKYAATAGALLSFDRANKTASFRYTDDNGVSRPLTVQYGSETALLNVLRNYLIPTDAVLTYTKTGASTLSFTLKAGGSVWTDIKASDEEKSRLLSDGEHYANKRILSAALLSPVDGDHFSVQYTLEGGYRLTVHYAKGNAANEREMFELLTLLSDASGIEKRVTLDLGENHVYYEFKQGAVRCSLLDDTKLAEAKAYTAKQITGADILSDSKVTYTFADGNVLTVQYAGDATAQMYADLRKADLSPTVMLVQKTGKLIYHFDGMATDFTGIDPAIDGFGTDYPDYVSTVKKIDGTCVIYADANGRELTVVYSGRDAVMCADLMKKLQASAITLYWNTGMSAIEKADYVFTAGGTVSFGGIALSAGSDAEKALREYSERALGVTGMTATEITFDYDGHTVKAVYPAARTEQMRRDLRHCVSPKTVALVYTSETAAHLDMTFEAGGTRITFSVTDTSDADLKDALAHLTKALTVSACDTGSNQVTYKDAAGRILTVTYANNAQMLAALREKATLTSVTLVLTSSGGANYVTYLFDGRYAVDSQEGKTDAIEYIKAPITDFKIGTGNTVTYTLDTTVGSKQLSVQYTSESQMIADIICLVAPSKITLQRNPAGGEKMVLIFSVNGQTKTSTIDAHALIKDGSFLDKKITEIRYSDKTNKILCYTIKGEGESEAHDIYVDYATDADLIADLGKVRAPSETLLTYGSGGPSKLTYTFRLDDGNTLTYDKTSLTTAEKEYYKRAKSATVSNLDGSFVFNDGTLKVKFYAKDSHMLTALLCSIKLTSAELSCTDSDAYTFTKITFDGGLSFTSPSLSDADKSAILALIDTGALTANGYPNTTAASTQSFDWANKTVAFTFKDGTKITVKYSSLARFVREYLKWNKVSNVTMKYAFTYTYSGGLFTSYTTDLPARILFDGTAIPITVSDSIIDELKPLFLPDPNEKGQTGMTATSIAAGSESVTENVKTSRTGTSNKSITEYRVVYSYADGNSLKVFYGEDRDAANAEADLYKDRTERQKVTEEKEITYTVTIKRSSRSTTYTITGSDGSSTTVNSVSKLAEFLKGKQSTKTVDDFESFKIKGVTLYKAKSTYSTTSTTDGSVSTDTDVTKNYSNRKYSFSLKYSNNTYSFTTEDQWDRNTRKTAQTNASFESLLQAVVDALNTNAQITLQYKVTTTTTTYQDITIPGKSKAGLIDRMSKWYAGDKATKQIGLSSLKTAVAGNFGSFIVPASPLSGGIGELFRIDMGGTVKLEGKVLYRNNKTSGNGDLAALFAKLAATKTGAWSIFQTTPAKGDLARLFVSLGNGTGGLGNLFLTVERTLSGLPAFFKGQQKAYEYLAGSLFRQLVRESADPLRLTVRGSGTQSIEVKTDFSRVGKYPGLQSYVAAVIGTDGVSYTEGGFNGYSMTGEIVASYRDWTIRSYGFSFGGITLGEENLTQYDTYSAMRTAQAQENDKAGNDVNLYVIESGAMFKYEIRRYLDYIEETSDSYRLVDVIGEEIKVLPKNYFCWSNTIDISDAPKVKDDDSGEYISVDDDFQKNIKQKAGNGSTTAAAVDFVGFIKNGNRYTYADKYYTVVMVAEFNDNDNVMYRSGSLRGVFNDGRKARYHIGDGAVTLTDTNDTIFTMSYDRIMRSPDFETYVLGMNQYIASVAGKYVYPYCDLYDVNIRVSFHTLEFTAEVVSKADPTDVVYRLHYTKG